MKVRLKGIKSSSFARADGTTVKYYYAWRGGPRLDYPDGTPITDKSDPHLHVAFTAAHEAAKKKGAGTLATLIAAYKDSEEYKSRAPKTKKDYDRYIAMIEAEYGSMPLKAVEDRRSRGDFKDWRDKIAEKSGDRTADYVWTVLARILSVAKDRGRISVNVCERGGRLYESDRNDKVWTVENENAFYAKAASHLHLPVLMALWTGQREGDLLRLTWLQYDGKHIRLRQGKGKKRVVIPVGAPLKAALEKLRAEAVEKNGGAPPDGPILRTMRGTAWTEDGFRASFGKACVKAGIDDLTFHDMRGTAVTRLAIAGATVPEIATITGHSLKTVQEILDTHYLSRDVAMADSGIAKLEVSKGFAGTGPLPAVKRRKGR